MEGSLFRAGSWRDGGHISLQVLKFLSMVVVDCLLCNLSFSSVFDLAQWGYKTFVESYQVVPGRMVRDSHRA